MHLFVFCYFKWNNFKHFYNFFYLAGSDVVGANFVAWWEHRWYIFAWESCYLFCCVS